MDVATMECDLKFRCIDEDFRGNTSERYKLELELAEHLVPTRGILAIRQAIDRQGGAPLPPSLRLLVVQLLQLRKAAFDQNWTFRTRQALMELSTALMFHSLQHCLWAESPLHFYPIWFAACLAAAGLVESKTLDYSWSA